MATEALRVTDGAIELRVRLQPQASKSEFVGLQGDRLKARVQAKPVEGAANAALVKLIAQTAGVPKSAVEIVRGATSREKDLRLTCAEPEAAARRIRAAAGIEE